VDPELARLLGLSPATADSIFAVLGQPEKPIKIDKLPFGTLGIFSRKDREIVIDPRQNREAFGTNVATTLAHEVGHQATSDRGRRNPMDPDIQGFVNLFFSQMEELPREKKRDLIENYFGAGAIENTAKVRAEAAGLEGYPAIDSITDVLLNRIVDNGLQGREMLEVLGATFGRGFDLAREADPANPGASSAKVAEAEEAYPGTRAAFNLFMRRFPR